MPSGGSVFEMTFVHPTIGTKTFRGVEAEEFTTTIGGLQTADDVKMDGGGNPIFSMMKGVAMLEGVVSWDMNTAQDLLALQQLGGSDLPSNSVTYTTRGSGKSYTIFDAKPVGPLAGNNMKATIAIKLAGSKLV